MADTTEQYDCEGYSLTTGLHKRLDVRRRFRAGYDEPISDGERAAAAREMERLRLDDERQAACLARAPITEDRPWGGHRLVAVSHEESKCVDCGAFFFEPDL